MACLPARSYRGAWGGIAGGRRRHRPRQVQDAASQPGTSGQRAAAPSNDGVRRARNSTLRGMIRLEDTKGRFKAMDRNAYHFLSKWRVEGTCGEVADILGDPLALPRWWPSV